MALPSKRLKLFEEILKNKDHKTWKSTSLIARHDRSLGPTFAFLFSRFLSIGALLFSARIVRLSISLFFIQGFSVYYNREGKRKKGGRGQWIETILNIP